MLVHPVNTLNAMQTPTSDHRSSVYLANKRAAHRISSVEAAALQIFSAPIKLDVAGRNGLSVHQPQAAPRRWPLLLNRSELCEYLGLSWRTLKGVLTVSPVDMGASVIRYNRQQIDAWVETRPSKSKLKVSGEGIHDDAEIRTGEAVTAALERARSKGRGRK